MSGSPNPGLIQTHKAVCPHLCSFTCSWTVLRPPFTVSFLAFATYLLKIFALSGQLHADDLVIFAESQADLQAAPDVIHAWSVRWRFCFGIGPTKSSAMVFGPVRSRRTCLVHQGGIPLLVVTQYRYLGTTFTPDLCWGAHIDYVCARGDRLLHQSSAWCHGEGLPASFSVSVFDIYVLSSVSFGLEHVGDDPAAISRLPWRRK